MVHLKPLSRATVERVSVGVAKLEFDVLVICFDGSGTNPEFLRDPTGSEARTAQSKDMRTGL